MPPFPHPTPSTTPVYLLRALTAAPLAVDAGMALDRVPMAALVPRTHSTLHAPCTSHHPSTNSPQAPVRAPSAVSPAVDAAMTPDGVPMAGFAPRPHPTVHPNCVPHLTPSASSSFPMRASTAALSQANAAAASDAVPLASFAPGTGLSLESPCSTTPPTRKRFNSVKSSRSCPRAAPAVVVTTAPALSAEGASAATARTVGALTTTAGASGNRHEQTRPRSRTAASTAEAAAAAAAFSAAVLARLLLATLRGAPSAGAQDKGALGEAFASAGALARAAPDVPESSEAATSEDENAEAAGVESQETLGEALGKGGCGWVLMADAIQDEWSAFIRRGARRMSARTAQPIINLQLLLLMEELGDAADIGRRQVPVPSGGGGRGGRKRAHIARPVHLALATVAAREGNILDVAYDEVTPHVLITMPRTPAQLAHTHTGLYFEEGGSGATLLSVYISFEEGNFFDVWPRTF